MPFKPGQTGNPGGRPKRGHEFYKTLDSIGIPLAISYLISVVDGTHPALKKMRDSGNRLRVQNEAAKALLSKAPERLEGSGDDGEIIVKWKND